MVFDTKDAFGGWKLLHREPCSGVNQLVTDMDISQDESRVVYSTLNDQVSVCRIPSIGDKSELHTISGVIAGSHVITV